MPQHNLSNESDAAILSRYVEGRDEGAFAELVRRHGPLVMGVARRILRNRHDTEDAFQATFFALASAAHSVKRQAAIAGWLHQTAVMTAKSIQRSNVTWKRKIERSTESMRVEQSFRQNDLATVLDDELRQLPAKYRTAVVLCDLEGLSRTEAARRLGYRSAP